MIFWQEISPPTRPLSQGGMTFAAQISPLLNSLSFFFQRILPVQDFALRVELLRVRARTRHDPRLGDIQQTLLGPWNAFDHGGRWGRKFLAQYIPSTGGNCSRNGGTRNLAGIQRYTC